MASQQSLPPEMRTAPPINRSGPSTYLHAGVILPVVCLVLVGVLLDSRQRNKLIQAERTRLASYGTAYIHSLQSAWDSADSTLLSLREFVQQTDADGELTDEAFARFASVLYAPHEMSTSSGGTGGWLQALQVVENGTIRYNYPDVGNEGVRNFDLYQHEDPTVVEGVRRAESADVLSVTPPRKLIQDTVGILMRRRVAPPDSKGACRLATVVIAVPRLLASAGIRQSASAPNHLVLKDGNGQIILGDTDIPDALSLPVPLGNTEWTLLLLPQGGWDAAVHEPLMRTRLILFVALLLGTAVVVLVFRRHALLSRQVRLRTAELESANQRLTEDYQKLALAESQLRRSEARFRAVFDQQSLGVALVDSRTRKIIEGNRRCIDLLEYDPKDCSDHLLPLSSNADRRRQEEQYYRSMQAGEISYFSLKKPVVSRSGARWVDQTICQLPSHGTGNGHWLLLLEDISTKHQFDEVLQQREAILNVVRNTATRLVSSHSVERILNDLVQEFGVATRVERTYVFRLQPNEENEICSTMIAEWTASGFPPRLGTPHVTDTSVIPAGFGRWLDLFSNGLPVHGHVRDFPKSERPILKEQGVCSLICIPILVDGNPVGFVGLDACHSHRVWSQMEIGALQVAAHLLSAAWRREATERRRRERELLYSGIIESAGSGIVVVGKSGLSESLDIRIWNPAIEEMLGYPRNVAEQPDFLARIMPDIAQRKRFLHSLIRANRGAAFSEQIWTMRAADGQVRSVQLNVRSVVDEDSETLLVFGITDITEVLSERRNRENLQRDLSRAQKMDAIGRMAGGIAHDFNNMLQVILSSLDLTLQTGDLSVPASEQREAIQMAHSAARRAADLTDQLLAFSGDTSAPLKPRPVNIDTEAMPVITMLRRVIGDGIDLQCSGSDELPAVSLEPGQLDQLLTNLVLNARDALNGTGVIKISSRLALLTGSEFGGSSIPQAGRYVQLSCEDNGSGIPAEILDRIFEPFFTTKPHGQGVGLGLAMVYAIAARHGGFVRAESPDGQPTAVHVYLPCADEASDTPEYAEPPASIPMQKAGNAEVTVLLVDDETLVLDLTERILKTQGYDVIACDSPAAVQQLDPQLLESVAVIVSDMQMPKMNGRELVTLLRQQGCRAPAVIMSGYSEETLPINHRPEDRIRRLSKPFLPAELIEIVDRLLNADDGAARAIS